MRKCSFSSGVSTGTTTILWVFSIWLVSGYDSLRFQYIDEYQNNYWAQGRPHRQQSRASAHVHYILVHSLSHRKLKQCHLYMQGRMVIYTDSFVSSKAHVCGGSAGVECAIHLSRVMLLDDVNDHAGGCFSMRGRIGHGSCVSSVEGLCGSFLACLRGCSCMELTDGAGDTGSARRRKPAVIRTSGQAD